MVVEDTYHSQLQSLVLVEVEEPLLQETSVKVVAKYMVMNGFPARNSVCFGCNKRGHFKTMCYSRKTQSHSHVLLNKRLSKKYIPMKTRTLVNQRMST